jgi:hypothetical protein
MTDETIAEMEAAVEACDDAREALTEALATADTHDGAPDDEAVLEKVGEALTDWRDAQQRFMEAVEASDAPDVATASMMLKTNHGIDTTNARRGLPGVHVEGTDKPFDLDLSGTRGSVLTNAAMQYVE